MADLIEMTGKTADEAVLKALKLLGVGKDEVNIEIVDAGSKGFLGFGQKPAKVKVWTKHDPGERPKSLSQRFRRRWGWRFLCRRSLMKRRWPWI